MSGENSHESWPIPSTWVATTLGEVFAWGSGGTPKSDVVAYYGGDIPWVVIGDLNDSPVLSTAACITEEGLKHSSAKWVHPGSVLLAMYGSIGKLGIAAVRLTTNQAIAFTNPSPISSKYLFWFLRSRREGLTALGKGGTQSNISQTVIKSFPFVIAPMQEQDRIVAEIEKHVTRLEAAVAALEHARANLKRYRAAVLKAACEGRLVPNEAAAARAEGRGYEPADALLRRILEERQARWTKGKYQEPASPNTAGMPPLPEGWAWATVEQTAVGDPQNGLYKPKSSYGRGTPILRIDDYQDFFVRSRDDLLRLMVSQEEALTYGLRPGDLIINRVNSPSHLGKCLLVPDSLPPAVFESNMMRLAPTPEVGQWVVLYLRTRSGRERLTARAKWAVNQASINQTDVRITPVPLPPLAEQRRIVAEAERRLSLIDDLKISVDRSLKRAGRLRQAVLKLAFEGGLVPQDPNDEPASVLLERIRAERAATSASAGGKRRSGRAGQRAMASAAQMRLEEARQR